jgi:hypothetical protein
MKKNTLIFCGVLAFMAIPSFSPALAAEQAAGKISGLQGKAQVFENGRWVPAALGSVVYPSSTIQTGYNSRVIITLRTGSQLALKPNTTISFNQIAATNDGSNVEVHLANGGVNSFVPRADEGKMNVFKVRSATAVAGVRGSFMSARRHGQHFAVNALHSPAFLEAAPAPSEKEIVRATLLNAIAQQESNALDAGEARACLQKQDAQLADSARARLQNAESGSREIGNRVQILKLFAERQNVAQALGETKNRIAEKNTQLREKTADDSRAGTPREVQEIREEIKSLEAGAKQQQAKLEGLNRSLTIAEGNGAQTQGMKVMNPLQTEMQKLRPQQTNMPGQTRQEGLFMFNNIDNQAGMGNDFQRLFNNVNRFNQQGTAVVPVLRKF